MKRIFLKIAVYCLSAVVMGSCVYDFVPDSSDLQGIEKPLVVIEGDIIVGGMTSVALKSTSPVLGGIEQDGISYAGASVWVENEEGAIWQGEPSQESGVHVVDTRGLSQEGRYRLCVSVPDRGEYRSAFKQVMVSPPIDNVSYEKADDNSCVQFEVSTHNSASSPLYCRWTFTEDWESNSELTAEIRAKYKEGKVYMEDIPEEEREEASRCYSHGNSTGIYIGSTEKLSQNVIDRERLHTINATDKRISSLYCMNISQTAMDKEAYKYWEVTKSSISGTGGLFAPMPSEIRGNITSVTFPDEKVIGYVNVSTESVKRVFVYAHELNMFKRNCNGVLYPEEEEGDNVWFSLYFSGLVPIRYELKENGDPDKSQAYWTSPDCVDCRIFSNSSRPAYWPEGR